MFATPVIAAADARALEPRADRRTKRTARRRAEAPGEALEVAEEISAASLVVEIKARLAERAVLAREARGGARGSRGRAGERSASRAGARCRTPSAPDPRLCAEAVGRTATRPIPALRAEPRACPRRRTRPTSSRSRSRRSRELKRAAGDGLFGGGPRVGGLLARLGVVSTPSVPLLVGTGGFEPPASCSQSRRANQAALRPEALSV